jgi:hypothetical protein
VVLLLTFAAHPDWNVAIRITPQARADTSRKRAVRFANTRKVKHKMSRKRIGVSFCQGPKRPSVPIGGKSWCAVVVTVIVAVPPAATLNGFAEQAASAAATVQLRLTFEVNPSTPFTATV